MSCDRWLSRAEAGNLRLSAEAPTGRIFSALVARPKANRTQLGSLDRSSSEDELVLVAGFSGLLEQDVARFLPKVECNVLEADACSLEASCVACPCTDNNASSCGCKALSDADQTCEQAASPAPESLCPSQPDCSSLSTCDICASDQRCQWLYDQTGSFAGLRGQCHLRGSAAVPDGLGLVDGGQCDYCGRRTSCQSCAGLTSPLRPGEL